MPNDKNFCPFIKGVCRNDCVFKYHNIALHGGAISDCLIAVKLSDINELQHDDISAIWSEIKKN
ncbi:hypothetical protein AB8U03_17860 [Clostridium sp. Mt-5]|uniref:Uncharacterized protein n=1 Tax=Clostridium moutaii TaxID=3240932 RepID=A0ABV4BT95_9CLOT